MREYYDPELSKTDPLKIMHLKIPASVQRALVREGAKVDRYPSYVARNILIAWERDLRNKRAANKSEEEVGADISTPPGFVTRRRKA